MLRGLFVSLSVYSLPASAQYVCSLSDFRRMIFAARADIEELYANVAATCAQMSAALTYSSQHQEMFPGTLINSSQLVPCPNHSQQLWLPDNPMIGIHVLNKSQTGGIPWNASAIDEEIQFLRPIIHVLPTFLQRNPNTPAIYFLGLAMECAAMYSYPPRDFCPGLLPDGANLCNYYNERHNLYAKLEDVKADAEQGGHWSEPLQSEGNATNSFSLPIPDASGRFRVQVQIGVDSQRIAAMFQALQPSANGYTFIVSSEGHLIYAQQAAIDILFGKDAHMTMEKITPSFNGQIKVAGVNLLSSRTSFARLPALLAEGEDPSNTTEGYYITWTKFEKTLSTWFMVGMIPRKELDEAAVWSVAPSWKNLTMSEERRDMNISFVVSNLGYLPFSFYVGQTPPSRGLRIIAENLRYTLGPGDSKTVEFLVQVQNTNFPATSRVLTPFYATATGYGPCFGPQFVDITINYLRKRAPEKRTYAVIIVLCLCSVTAVLIFVAYYLLYRYRNSPPVLAISPFICIFHLLGLLFLLGSSAVNIAPVSEASCEVARWLFHIGFVLAASTTVAKNYRLRRIFYSKKLSIVPLTNYQLLGFITAIVLVDVLLLVIGTIIEPYSIQINECIPQGWVIFVILIFTKIVAWGAAFYYTVSLSRVPQSFNDSRLNGVLVVVSILATVYVGLQFSGVLATFPFQLLFIGAMFTWLGAFCMLFHLLLKLRSGYVVIVRSRLRTNSISLTPSSHTQTNRLRCRLGALLEEMEVKQAKLVSDKTNAIDNVEANQKLLFELRAMLLSFEVQDGKGEISLDEEALEKHLPESIKEAFDKHERAVARRLESERPIASRGRTPTADHTAERKFSQTTIDLMSPAVIPESTPGSKSRRIVAETTDEEPTFHRGNASISPGHLRRERDEARSLLHHEMLDQSNINHTD